MFLISDDYWQIQKTKEKGYGVFAKKNIKAGTIISDYLGKVIKTAEYDLEKDKFGLYLMYYSDETSIYPNLKKPGPHLLNHSCTPNCWIYIHHGHTLFFALRRIFVGEELTISYLLAPYDKFCKKCTHICNCESLFCSNSMHLDQKMYKTWRIFQDKHAKNDKRVKIFYGKELKPLLSYPKSISDNPIYSLFGNSHKPALNIKGKTVPSTKELRKLIRKTGRIINLPSTNTKIYGVQNNLVISKNTAHL